MENVNIVDELRKYLKNTPKEQLEKDRKSLEKWNDIGPTVEEFLGQIPELWKIAVKGAKFMVEEVGYDYDSSAMDSFLTAIGCDIHDMDFMDYYFTNITKELGLNDED